VTATTLIAVLAALVFAVVMVGTFGGRAVGLPGLPDAPPSASWERVLVDAPKLVIPTNELDRTDREERLVHAWRVEQLRSLGIPFVLAESFADRVDWHTVANLIDRGCPLHLALDIVR